MIEPVLIFAALIFVFLLGWVMGSNATEKQYQGHLDLLHKKLEESGSHYR